MIRPIRISDYTKRMTASVRLSRNCHTRQSRCRPERNCPQVGSLSKAPPATGAFLFGGLFSCDHAVAENVLPARVYCPNSEVFVLV